MWKDFDDSLPLEAVISGKKTLGGVRYEYVSFSGRKTEDGRVRVFGVFACNAEVPSSDGVLIIPDSSETVDERLLRMFVDNGYSALMVDIRGSQELAEAVEKGDKKVEQTVTKGVKEGEQVAKSPEKVSPEEVGANAPSAKVGDMQKGVNFTVYPPSVSYANFASAGRHIDFADDGADKTSWYEWVAVGLYARKFLATKVRNDKIGVVGIRDGGEVAWKLAYAGNFSCAVPVCAVGWRAYKGYSKFGTAEPAFDEERHRFIAAIDSQAYAPYVKCPVLMLCSTNDPDFDYDRAYDTFSRVNPQFAGQSVITYSVKSNACIAQKSTKDMFMFLDRYIKLRQVFIPKPAELSVTVDGDDNLIARAAFDDEGVVETFGLYMAEDCKNPTVRDWIRARYKGKVSDAEHDFYLDVYNKTGVLFALCYVTYTNGFTVWSKITVKKISGTFRNSQSKCRVLYSSRNGIDCFSLADYGSHAVAGTFFENEQVFPQMITRNELKGIYCVCGLSTYRLNSPRYSPSQGSLLKFDIYTEKDCTIELSITSVGDGTVFSLKVPAIGGTWQSEVLESKLFKSIGGMPLADFSMPSGLMFTIKCDELYALNNVMWL